jgi:hypothetical protein
LEASSAGLYEHDWRRIRELVQSVVKEGAKREANKLIHLLYHFQVQNQLQLHEIASLKEAIVTKKKQKKKGKALPLQQDGEYHEGAILCSPKKVKEAHEH